MWNNIILIGFKGAGKTTLGRKVARDFGCPFIDTDDLFEEPPALLYQKMGPEAFRALEKEHLHSLVHLKGHIIATGGGIVLDADNQLLLLSLGLILHLNTPKEIIIQRIGDHPFLAEYDKRLGIYSAIAHYSITTEREIWEVIHLDPYLESRRGVNLTDRL